MKNVTLKENVEGADGVLYTRYARVGVKPFFLRDFIRKVTKALSPGYVETEYEGDRYLLLVYRWRKEAEFPTPMEAEKWKPVSVTKKALNGLFTHLSRSFNPTPEIKEVKDV